METYRISYRFLTCLFVAPDRSFCNAKAIDPTRPTSRDNKHTKRNQRISVWAVCGRKDGPGDRTRKRWPICRNRASHIGQDRAGEHIPTLPPDPSRSPVALKMQLCPLMAAMRPPAGRTGTRPTGNWKGRRVASYSCSSPFLHETRVGPRFASVWRRRSGIVRGYLMNKRLGAGQQVSVSRLDLRAPSLPQYQMFSPHWPALRCRPQLLEAGFL